MLRNSCTHPYLFVLCLRQRYPCVPTLLVFNVVIVDADSAALGRPVFTTLTATQPFLLNDPPRRVQANSALPQQIFEGWRKY